MSPQQTPEPGNGQPGGEPFLDPVAQALSAIRKAGGRAASGQNKELPRHRAGGWNRGRRGTLTGQPRGQRPGARLGDAQGGALADEHPGAATGFGSGGVRRINTRMDGRADRSYRDPGSFSVLLNREIRRQGWEENVGVRRLMQDWESLVGPKIAAHTRAVKFDDKKKFLHVQSDSTPWATQLRLIQTTILRKIAEQLGPDVVVELKIHNPNYGPQQKGRLRVQGRGKRDDYG